MIPPIGMRIPLLDITCRIAAAREAPARPTPIDRFLRTAERLCRELGLPPPGATRAPSPRSREGRFDPAASVVIGDSQSAGLEAGGAMPCRIEDASGQRIDHFATLLSSNPGLVRNQELVVLQMGGNDITGGRNAADIITSLRNVIAKVRAINPNATIVLSTIPVRGQWFDQLPDRAAAANAESAFNGVNAWILQQSEVEVFDVNAIAADGTNPRMPRVDFRRAEAWDVHFNSYGYRTIGRALAERLF